MSENPLTNNNSQKNQPNQGKDLKKTNPVAAGFSSMRDVWAVNKRIREEEKTLNELMASLKENKQMYAHRSSITENYADIESRVASQLQQTQANLKQSQGVSKDVQNQLDYEEGVLQQTKAAHEQELRPYKQMSDAAQGRLDDAARSLTDAKRAHKAGEASLKDATEHRDGNIANAHQAIDNARIRVRELEKELAQADASGSNRTYLDMREAILIEKRRLEDAQNDLKVLTEQTTHAIDNAQDNLLNQKKILEAARTENDEAKAEAKARRSEYEKRFDKAKSVEKTLEKKIENLTGQLKQLSQEQSEMETTIHDLQDQLHEANEIFNTPQKTLELAAEIDKLSSDINLEKQDLAALKAQGAKLKSKTKKQRMLALGVCIGIICILIVIAYFFFIKK